MARKNKKSPFVISWRISNYNGKPIKTLTPIHQAQQIHKYRLALFVNGLVALVAAFVDIVLIALAISKGQSAATSSGIITSSLIFVIALLNDVIFTANLNRYINDKHWLFLYIPCLVAMIIFCIPQMLTLLKLFNISLSINIMPEWANYINIVVCSIYVGAELTRMILKRKELDIWKEMMNVLK